MVRLSKDFIVLTESSSERELEETGDCARLW